MDKLTWLKKMVEQNTDDPQAHYFYGKELVENNRYIEAVQALSAAISKCNDESLKMEMIQELTKVSLMMNGNKKEEPQNKDGSQLEHETEQFFCINEDEKVGVDIFSEAPEEGEFPLASENGLAGDEKTEDFSIDEEIEGDHVFGDFEEEEEENGKAKAANILLLEKSKKQPFQVIDGGNYSSEKSDKETITFDDVAGLEELKKTIYLRIISPFRNKGLFAKFRKKAGGGVLLYGPPGCGKTFIARATAGECKANFYPVHITDILDPYVGVSEQNLKDIFDKARLNKPSILFFDEVDTIGYSRLKSSQQTYRGMIDTFLMELDGIDSAKNEILVIAATNTPWDVDNALKRPGRFDRLIFVAPPDEKARGELFGLKLKGRYTEDIKTEKLAAATEFFSGADIENVVELSTEKVIEEILITGVERPIKTQDLLEVIENVRPSTLDWLRTAKNYVKFANHSGQYNDVEAYLKKYGRRI